MLDNQQVPDDEVAAEFFAALARRRLARRLIMFR
jgi:hypothetical protein